MYTGLCIKYPVFLSDFKEFFSKNTQISNFTKIRPLGGELFHADRRSDMTNAPKKRPYYPCSQQIIVQQTTEKWTTVKFTNEWKMCLCAQWTSINRDVCWAQWSVLSLATTNKTPIKLFLKLACHVNKECDNGSMPSLKHFWRNRTRGPLQQMQW
jgi:hypothetical protein